MIGNIWLY